jgi:hypothetical protein
MAASAHTAEGEFVRGIENRVKYEVSRYESLHMPSINEGHNFVQTKNWMK